MLKRQFISTDFTNNLKKVKVDTDVIDLTHLDDDPHTPSIYTTPFLKSPALLLDLMPHQIQGVQFMLSQESSSLRGGILADDMGLGKTVQSIALILSNLPLPTQKCRTTLIIAPLSILH